MPDDIALLERRTQAEAEELARLLRGIGEALPQPEHDAAFGAFFDRFGDARVVLLGEATHGTSEFYRARAAITQRLITTHGFNIVAVEADWPDAARIDRYVRHLGAGHIGAAGLRALPDLDVAQRGGAELSRLAAAPQRESAGRAARRRSAVSTSTASARRSRRCSPISTRSIQRRGRRAPALRLPDAVAGRAGRLRPRGALRAEGFVRGGGGRAAQRTARPAARLLRQDGEAFFDAAQNARIVRAAERYYRIMYRGGDEIVESARPPHVRHAADAAARRRRRAPRPWSGRTTRISATPQRPRWAGRASSISANCAAPLTATRRC